jgi:hypothetical protein
VNYDLTETSEHFGAEGTPSWYAYATRISARTHTALFKISSSEIEKALHPFGAMLKRPLGMS